MNRLFSLSGLVLAGLLAGCQADKTPAVIEAQASQQVPGLDMDIDLPFEKFELDNGLRVIVHEDRKAPIVAVGVWYHVGSKDEPEGKTYGQTRWSRSLPWHPPHRRV